MPNEKDHLTAETREELFAAIRDYADAVRKTAEAEAALREVINSDLSYAATAAEQASERVRCAVSDETFRRIVMQDILTKIQ